jgi:hypothetical protein
MAAKPNGPRQRDPRVRPRMLTERLRAWRIAQPLTAPDLHSSSGGVTLIGVARYSSANARGRTRPLS